MDNKYVTSLSIALSYLALKFVDARFIKKEDITFKELLKEAIFVFISALTGAFIAEQFGPLTDNITSSVPVVFTSEPDF